MRGLMQLALPLTFDGNEVDFGKIKSETERRYLSGDQVAATLTALRGPELLVAAFMFGCGASFEDVMRLELADISISRGTVTFKKGHTDSRTESIPAVLLDDLKEHLLDLRCGRNASPDTKSEAKVFLFGVKDSKEYELPIRNAISLSCRNHALSSELLIWARSPHVAICEGFGCSPIDLFEKGPMIVRRSSGTDRGYTDRYYLWRFRGTPLVKKDSRRPVRRERGRDQDSRKIPHQLRAAA